MTKADPKANILVAATGGVAALKTPALLRRLDEAGYAVRVAATDASFNFVTRLALALAAVLGLKFCLRRAVLYPAELRAH